MIRFKGLGYVALGVSDVDRSVEFYRDVSDLNLTERVGDSAFLRCSDKHHDLVLTRADKPGLARIAFALAQGQDCEAARAHLEGLGVATRPVARAELDMLKLDDAFRFTDPVGIEVEIYGEMARAAKPYEPQLIKIARLGHCVIGTPDVAKSVAFYNDVLGFRISDQIDDVMYWMRSFPNPLHHSFGIARRASTALHHINFMVTDIDDIGRGRNRLIASEAEIVFGPGRHMPSDSIFLYFRDPDGMVNEWSFGMEEIPEEAPRDPRHLARDPLVLDMWGGRPASEIG